MVILKNQFSNQNKLRKKAFVCLLWNIAAVVRGCFVVFMYLFLYYFVGSSVGRTTAPLWLKFAVLIVPIILFLLLIIFLSLPTREPNFSQRMFFGIFWKKPEQCIEELTELSSESSQNSESDDDPVTSERPRIKENQM